MSTDTTSETDAETDQETHVLPVRATALARNVSRVVADVLAVGLWVLFVTLLTLEGVWSRVQFYSLLVLGVLCYVLITREYERIGWR